MLRSRARHWAGVAGPALFISGRSIIRQPFSVISRFINLESASTELGWVNASLFTKENSRKPKRQPRLVRSPGLFSCAIGRKARRFWRRGLRTNLGYVFSQFADF